MKMACKGKCNKNKKKDKSCVCRVLKEMQCMWTEKRVPVHEKCMGTSNPP